MATKTRCHSGFNIERFDVLHLTDVILPARNFLIKVSFRVAFYRVIRAKRSFSRRLRIFFANDFELFVTGYRVAVRAGNKRFYFGNGLFRLFRFAA